MGEVIDATVEFGEKYQVSVEEAARIIAGVKEGTTLLHDSLAHIIGETYPSQGYYNRLDRVRDELREVFGKFLRTEQGTGYTVVKRGQEIDVCVGKYEKGMRGMREAITDSVYIELDKIEDRDARERTIRISGSMASVGLFIKFSSQKAEEVKELPEKAKP